MTKGHFEFCYFDFSIKVLLYNIKYTYNQAIAITILSVKVDQTKAASVFGMFSGDVGSYQKGDDGLLILLTDIDPRMLRRIPSRIDQSLCDAIRVKKDW